MNCVRTLPVWFFVASVLTLPGGQAHSATDTGTFSVTATVKDSCTLNGETLDLGYYVTGQADDLDVDGTLAVAVSWPQSVDSGETHGSINVSVIVVDCCEVVADAELSEIDQICADLSDLGQVTVAPAGEADPPSDAADAIDEVAGQHGADIQLVTISY